MFQSQTGSQALSDSPSERNGYLVVKFQSQTGSQALSDQVTGVGMCGCRVGFNPKREARPSQTPNLPDAIIVSIGVSIPNGKPGPLRH